MSWFRGARFTLGKMVVTPALENNTKPEGAVIILHGSCDTGNGMKSWLERVNKAEFNFKNYRVLYPSAPVRPYTLLNGQKVNIWFDRHSLGPFMPEDKYSIEGTANELSKLILDESEATGIPLKRMIVGGFSMGGIMALHMGYRFHSQMAGVFAFSSCLPEDSEVFRDLKQKKLQLEKIRQRKATASTDTTPKKTVEAGKRRTTSLTPTMDKIMENAKGEDERKGLQYPPLFMSHGLRDPLVLSPWASKTFSALREHGVEGHFYTHQKGEHSIRRNQLILLHRWIQEILSGKPGSKPSGRKIRPRKYHVNDEACEPLEPELW